MPTPWRPLADRFWEKVNKANPDDCWLWSGATRKSSGYGAIGDGKRPKSMLYAHRVSWELHNGPIPEGLGVLHKCDVRN